MFLSAHRTGENIRKNTLKTEQTNVNKITSLIQVKGREYREYTEISRTTHHSIAAVKSYIEKFKRVVALAGEGFDADTIAFLVKISAPLVTEYYRLYGEVGCVPHRKAELTHLLKKNQFPLQVSGGSNE